MIENAKPSVILDWVQSDSYPEAKPHDDASRARDKKELPEENHDDEPSWLIEHLTSYPSKYMTPNEHFDEDAGL